MSEYAYIRCDVFTQAAYSGNPLAVLPDASGLGAGAMQRVAAELNLSETVFVFPGDPPTLRIFTPRAELPFAGHPTIGAAFVLACAGWPGPDGSPARGMLSLVAGVVPIEIERDADGRPGRVWLTAPRAPEPGPHLPQGAKLATALGLDADALHPEWSSAAWSGGVPFACIALRDAAALTRAGLDHARWSDLAASGVDGVYAFAPGDGPGELAARMFAPALGIEEDPATGAAATALAGLLAGLTGPGEHGWVIHQGIDMGRPSRLELRYTAAGDGVRQVRLGGHAVGVGRGTLHAPGMGNEPG